MKNWSCMEYSHLWSCWLLWEGGGIHQHSNKKQSGDLQPPFPGELICNLENVAINHHRLLLMEHGLWDQLRVDHGNEWVLMLSVQKKINWHIFATTYLTPQSTNIQTSVFIPSVWYAYICILIHHTLCYMYCRIIQLSVFWPEVSSRVNYPIKACLIEMNIFDIDAETHKFCVSWFCLRVATIGCPLCVKSWIHTQLVPGMLKCGVFS